MKDYYFRIYFRFCNFRLWASSYGELLCKVFGIYISEFNVICFWRYKMRCCWRDVCWWKVLFVSCKMFRVKARKIPHHLFTLSFHADCLLLVRDGLSYRGYKELYRTLTKKLGTLKQEIFLLHFALNDNVIWWAVRAVLFYVEVTTCIFKAVVSLRIYT